MFNGLVIADVEGDTISLSLTPSMPNFAITGGPVYSIITTGGLDFETTPSFILSLLAEDNHGAWRVMKYSVQLLDDNEAPVLLPQVSLACMLPLNLSLDFCRGFGTRTLKPGHILDLYH